VFDLHASRPAVHTVDGCRSQKNQEQRLQLHYNRIRVIMKHVITSFQFTKDPLSVCRSTEILWIYVCKRMSPRSAHNTSLTLTHSLTTPAVLAGHGVTVEQVRTTASRRLLVLHNNQQTSLWSITLAAGWQFTPKRKHRNATRRNDLCKNETATMAVSSR